MLIPKSMKSSISEAFYDKEISILDTSETFDAEGGLVKDANNIKDTFKGNVRFINLKAVQEEYGLDYQIDVAITTFREVNVKVADVISYLDKKYFVKDAIPNDSHLLIVGELWQSKI